MLGCMHAHMCTWDSLWDSAFVVMWQLVCNASTAACGKLLQQLQGLLAACRTRGIGCHRSSTALERQDMVGTSQQEDSLGVLT